jgi:uncharacterized protein
MKDSRLAIVTGASSGIGYELALICAREGYEVLIAADSPEIEQAASQLRTQMLDTAIGQAEKDDPADVANVGYEAMMRGDGDVVSGWKNKLQTVMANVTPAGVLAEQHRKQAEPGSAPADAPAARTAGR